MTFLRLFWEFFKIGLFAVGGGSATIPFLFDLQTKTNWFSAAELSNMIAISNSTPGAIGVNMSTYVGYKTVYGILGSQLFGALAALVATLGVIIPGLIIIIIISHFLQKFSNNKYVNYTFYGLRAASCALVAYATYILFKLCLVATKVHGTVFGLSNKFNWLNYKSLIYLVVITFLVFKYKKSPVFYIIISAIIGMIFHFAEYPVGI